MGQGGAPKGREETFVGVPQPRPGSDVPLVVEPLVDPWSKPQKSPESDPQRYREPKHLLRRVTRRHLLVVLALLTLVVVVVVLAACLAVLNRSQCSDQRGQTKDVQGIAGEDLKVEEVLPPCDDGWIWYQHKCYYFSDADGNWTKANDFCTSLNSFLAVIEDRRELDFMMRYKGIADHWIGLKRDTDQPWKWANGTLFNDVFPIEDYSECAYLNHVTVRSARCDRIRHWSCTKVSIYERKRKKRQLNMLHFR